MSSQMLMLAVLLHPRWHCELRMMMSIISFVIKMRMPPAGDSQKRRVLKEKEENIGILRLVPQISSQICNLF